jgi:uncharacterized protein YidB (DUF937 family)
VRGGNYRQERIGMLESGADGQKRARTGAREAGAASKPTARDAVAQAFEEVGGVAALAEWVEASDDNRKIFYATIYPKILSLQTGGEAEVQPIHEIRRTIVRP